MQWPEQPTCHAHQQHYPGMPADGWETRSDEHFRRCNYCGSMHPEDLIAALAQGGTLGGSDWKYAWPHKFYVTVPNPTPDRHVYIGGRSYFDEVTQQRVSTKEYGPQGPTIGAKWYNTHLLDLGYDAEALATLLETLERHSQIAFQIEDGRLSYRAPRFGFQV